MLSLWVLHFIKLVNETNSLFASKYCVIKNDHVRWVPVLFSISVSSEHGQWQPMFDIEKTPLNDVLMAFITQLL